MPDEKLTDNEIVKALEYCFANTDVDCGKCAYNECDGNCVDGLIKDALSLINRQKAEIELLQKMQQLTRAEAIKEFAERLKDTKFKHGNDYMIYAENIDNLVKEMVGDV